jgi:hypothetical protein
LAADEKYKPRNKECNILIDTYLPPFRGYRHFALYPPKLQNPLANEIVRIYPKFTDNQKIAITGQ